MSNEARRLLNRSEQEKLLVNFYTSVLTEKDTPSPGYQKKYLLQLLNTKISQLEPKTDRIKNLHYFLRITAMLFSAITTILLGLKLSDDSIVARNISNTALIISSTVTFLTGLAVFWDTENHWIRNKIMLNKLKELRYEYMFFVSGKSRLHSADLKPFLDKFLSSLGDEYWEKFLKDLKREPEKPAEPALEDH